jgi:predicted nuclease with RNAse H fold
MPRRGLNMPDTKAARKTAPTQAAARAPASRPAKNLVTAGIDVGGVRKGFHGVALRGGHYWRKFSSTDPRAMAAWCREAGAIAVGIDAPARFSEDGRMRPCERALARELISCFATPTLERARATPFYAWMLNGAALFAAVETTHRLYDGGAPVADDPVCFETFPQAIACALAGKPVSAKEKNTVRRALLAAQGFTPAQMLELRLIDEVDAALCALAAWRLVQGKAACYGEAESGFIVVPVHYKKAPGQQAQAGKPRTS